MDRIKLLGQSSPRGKQNAVIVRHNPILNFRPGYAHIEQDPHDATGYNHVSIFYETEPSFKIADYWEEYYDTKISSIFYLDYSFRICILSNKQLPHRKGYYHIDSREIKKIFEVLRELDIPKRIPQICDKQMIDRILTWKEIKKYVKNNPNNVSYFVIVYILPPNDDYKYQQFLALFDAELIDKICPFGDFIIAFLQHFSEYERIKHMLFTYRSYRLCTDVDQIHPSLFNEKFVAINRSLRQLREEINRQDIVHNTE